MTMGSVCRAAETYTTHHLTQENISVSFAKNFWYTTPKSYYGKVFDMKIHKSITANRVIKAVRRDDSLGFCIACGHGAKRVEPDARNYECEKCRLPKVFGAEELLPHVLI